MATEPNDPTESTETALERPEFRGCAVCYSAELALYAVRKVRR